MGLVLQWEADSTRQLWFRANTNEGELFIKMNRLPDDRIWSLQVDHGAFLDFNELPSTWPQGPFLWPETAAPRWDLPHYERDI